MTGTNRRILLIGPAPDNVGGVSIHLRRLMALMQGRVEWDFIDESRTRRDDYFNLRSLNLVTYFKKLHQAHVVHIHSGSRLLRLFNVAMCRIMGKTTIVTVHRDPSRESMQWLTRWALSGCDVVIAVSKKGQQLLSTRSGCEYLHIPAFIPPVMDREPALPTSVEDWIDNVRRNDRSVVMTNNASALVLNNGEDLYGLDLCLEAMKRLGDSGCDNYYLVFVVVKCDNPQLMDKYRDFITRNGIGDHVLLLDEPCSFVRLMTRSDLVLRTTNTDGDSLTVREALSLGIPVLASDCSERPQGTLIFKNRDTESLVDAIKACPSRGQQEIDTTDYAALYSRIYKK